MKAYVVVFLMCFGSIASELIPHQSQQYYGLISKVSVTDLHSPSKHETSYIFRSQIKINSVWNSDKDQLLQLYFINPVITDTGKKDHALDITEIPDRPFYISLVDGVPRNVIAHTSRDQSLLNIERGIASLLQLRYESGPVSEVDVSGHCTAFYSVKSSTRIEKSKTGCSHWDLKVHARSEKPLSLTQYSREMLHFDLNGEGFLVKAESMEHHRIGLEANQQFGSEVNAEFTMEHLAIGNDIVEQWKFPTLKAAIESTLDWYRVFDIEADVDGAISEIKGTSLKIELAKYAKEMTDEQIGTADMANVLAKLLPLARITKDTDFIDILRLHKEIRPQLVDLLGGVQTIDAHNAINVVIDLKEEPQAYENYLQALAVGVHPDRAIMDDLLQRMVDKDNSVANMKIRDSIVQTLCSLIQRSGLEPNDPLLQKTSSFILTQIKDVCKGEECSTLYIRGLQNLRDPSTIPPLMELVLEDNVKVSRAAMQAIKSFPTVNFGENHRKFFSQIFYQVKRTFDSSVRTMALDILLAMKPTRQQLYELLIYLNSNERQYEIKTYVIQMLRMLAEKCPKFQALLQSCLIELPMVNNYDVLAQKGLSTVLTRQLASTPAFNESLLSIQEIQQGILKRGSVELMLSAAKEHKSIFKLVLFTGGLTSFVGDSSGEEADDDGSPATAGMEIYVQDVAFRPLIFFSGQSELMGHIWSGTASELTPAYQATTVTFDHEHYIMLGSGATVYISVVGAHSIDLNGKVDLSIWNRNANTEINQNSGAAIVGKVIAGFTYGRVEHSFVVKYEPKLRLQANLDFYSDIKLCMRLERPTLNLRYESQRNQTLKKHMKSVRAKTEYKIPGRTLALNQKNNDMCNMLLE